MAAMQAEQGRPSLHPPTVDHMVQPFLEYTTSACRQGKFLVSKGNLPALRTPSLLFYCVCKNVFVCMYMWGVFQNGKEVVYDLRLAGSWGLGLPVRGRKCKKVSH